MQIKISDASQLMNVTTRTIYRMIDEGKVKKEDQGMVNQEDLFLQFPTVMALYNQKGGVGKTTMSFILADYFSNRGLKTLVVDFDPQTDLSRAFFDYEELKDHPSLFKFFESNTPLSKIVKSKSDNLDILPANPQMFRIGEIDTILLEEFTEPMRQFFKDYQVVIIDCSPSLNMYTRLALILANYCFIPLDSEPFAYEGLTEVVRTISMITKFNKNFYGYHGYIYNKRSSTVASIFKDAIKDFLKDKLLENELPQSVSYVERIVHKENLFITDKTQQEAKQKAKSISDEIYNIIYNGERKS